MPIKGKSPKEIVHTEMHKFKHGSLRSGSQKGPLVKSRKQAIAIALSESGQSKRAYGGKVEAALRIAGKMARGGDVDDNYDPSNKGQIPRSIQYMTDKVPDTWTRAPERRYAEGGASPFDWSGVGEAMPENIGKDKIMDPVANVAIGAATTYPGYIKSMVDAAKTQPGSEEAHEAYGDVAKNTGDMGLSMIGPKGGSPTTAGVFVGPYGALALRNAAKESGNIAAEKALIHPVVGKELEKEVQSMPEWMRDPYRLSVQEARDDWARKTLEQRAAKGDFNDRDVFSKSGWSFTADHKPAKEISDVGAKVIPHPDFPENSGKYMISHPAGDLHKTYDIPPIEKGVSTIKNVDAYFRRHSNGDIGIGITGDPLKNTSPALHEMQHAISHREGWPAGSNPKATPKEVTNRELFPGEKLPEYQRELFMKSDKKVNPEMLDRLDSSPNTAALAAYLHSAGENQAFNVQHTRSHPFKYLIHPADREIVPRAFQHVEYKAGGGNVGNFNPERGEAFGLAQQGMIKSDVPGRTDKLHLNVPAGSYIIPSDIVSALGEGNSLGGSKILEKMFSTGPYGMKPMKGGSSRRPRMPSMRFASGGETEETLPIIAAGGEWIVHPPAIRQLGGGDMEVGHRVLDKFVLHIRKKHVKTLRHLKPPKGSK